MATVAFYVDGQQGKNYPVRYYGVFGLQCVSLFIMLWLYHTTPSLDDSMKLWLANEIAKRKSTKGKSKVKEKRTKK